MWICRTRRSTVGACGAKTSEVLRLLDEGHYRVQLGRTDMDRLITWMDTYAQRSGSFSGDQEQRLDALRERVTHLMVPSTD